MLAGLVRRNASLHDAPLGGVELQLPALVGSIILSVPFVCLGAHRMLLMANPGLRHARHDTALVGKQKPAEAEAWNFNSEAE
jgi:hypothetical protein